MLALFVMLLSTAVARVPGPDMDEAIADAAMPPPPDAAPAQQQRCSDQYLKNGVQLPERAGLYTIAQPSGAWGTALMVETILKAGEEMAWQLPDADPFVVGDISSQRGGYFDGHRSHRGGVDADLGIYAKGGKQSPRGFQDLAPSELDAAATWTFIRTLLETGNVERIYLDQSLINALRKHVREVEGLSAEEVDRIFPPPGTPRTWAMAGVVQHVPGHRNHIHVRVFCDSGVPAGD